MKLYLFAFIYLAMMLVTGAFLGRLLRERQVTGYAKEITIAIGLWWVTLPFVLAWMVFDLVRSREE